MKQRGAKPGHGGSLRFRTIITLLGLLGLVALSPDLRAEEPQVMTPGEIHSLPREEAALGRSVKVRGVVTFAYPEEVGEFVIEDVSGGLYISAGDPEWNRKPPPVASLVEVTGVTGEGGYAPVVRVRAVEILGQVELPLARPATANQLLTGRFDSRRVEIRGVVRHVIQRDRVESFALELAGEFGRVTVFSLEAGGIAANDLIDAEVIVRGVCFPFFNERAQVAGARLEMASAREIEITRPPAAEPFSTPLVSLDRLQPFSPEGMNFHRQRIRGTVTLVNPGNYLYLQDGNHAVRVNLAERSPVEVGDRVEAVGFPGVRTRFVEWQQAILKKTGVAPVPAPVAISPNLVLLPASRIEDRARNDWDGRLISLTGRLEKVESLKNGARQLFMDCDGHVVAVLLDRPDSGGPIDALRPGSTIAATGICMVDYSETWPTLDYVDPTGMSLLLRRSDDVTVLQAASWWTPVRLRLALGGILAILLASLAWVMSLRRQVIRRTAALASETRARRDAEVEFDATLRERERMAVDLHDTVEQALTGVSYQLVISEALYETEPQRSMQHFDLAKQFLAQSREEVRRSVWNLRAQALNGRQLAEVLRDVAASLSTRNPVQTRVTVNGEERELPDFIAGHLLLLAQESMTNAIKHGQPKSIHITLEFDETSVELRVHDDGTGFDPGQAPGLTEGHLGLQGMRERMKRLGGVVKVESSPGQGTTIRARVPLPE
jgi:signal transduction histidine kinase